VKRINTWIAITLAALLLAPAVLLAAGGSSGSVPSADPVAELTPEQKAMVAYNEGLEHRNKAWKLEEEVASAEGAKADKKAMKAQKAYKKAIEKFRTAVEQVPNFHQAFSSLGYALRKTGQYQESLEAYDRSLAIDPSQLDGYWGRAQTFHQMKLYTRALADCEKVLAIETDFQPAQALIRRIAGEAF